MSTGATQHGIWANDVINTGSGDEPVWVHTLVCWCGEKFGPGPLNNDDLENQMDQHIEDNRLTSS